MLTLLRAIGLAAFLALARDGNLHLLEAASAIGADRHGQHRVRGRRHHKARRDHRLDTERQDEQRQHEVAVFPNQGAQRSHYESALDMSFAFVSQPHASVTRPVSVGQASICLITSNYWKFFADWHEGAFKSAIGPVADQQLLGQKRNVRFQTRNMGT